MRGLEPFLAPRHRVGGCTVTDDCPEPGRRQGVSTESPHSIVEGWPVCRACQGSRVLVCYTHGVSKDKPPAPPGGGAPGLWISPLASVSSSVCSMHRPVAAASEPAPRCEAGPWSWWALGVARLLSGSVSLSVPPASPTGCCEDPMGFGVWALGCCAIGSRSRRPGGLTWRWGF